MIVQTSRLILALATGFAAAGPIQARYPEPLPAYERDLGAFSNLFSKDKNQVNDNNNNNNNLNGVLNLENNGRNANDGRGYNFGRAFNDFNNQEQFIQIQEQTIQIASDGRGGQQVQQQEQNVQIVDNGNGVQQIQQEEQNVQIVDNGRGVQQAIIEQSKQVLVADQRNARFNDLFRQSSFRGRKNDVSTVMLVVQKIQVSVDDGRGNVLQREVFAQSAVVANRGRRSTETVLVSDERQLIATQILNNDRNNNNRNDFNRATATAASVEALATGLVNGTAVATTAEAQAATRTNNVALFDKAPTWSKVEQDPAATMAAQMQAELEALLSGSDVEERNREEEAVLKVLKNA
ncbi:hypothetical protein GQ43DRAFT_468681 [Delitschia confertaspora ATCC 74209]|uniref:Uncharacterized protein n=1 Tax=Delitschia confertaspora ATCC 74209 TaxID=1513339 RepID=A0A9P4MVP3_9PLEO|nr:hypothetical protein GQ43DRAFT_468681 [Delitschia confertaspora ATCC 74209]